MTLSMKLRIALLVCASGASIFKGKRYAELFRDLFRDEFIMDEFYVQGQMPLVPSSAEYRVQIGYPENLSEYAMVALTGSSKQIRQTSCNAFRKQLFQSDRRMDPQPEEIPCRALGKGKVYHTS